MAPKLRRPVRWFTIVIVEKKTGEFTATARCCFTNIEPQLVRATAKSPRGALKRLSEAMKDAWGKV